MLNSYFNTQNMGKKFQIKKNVEQFNHNNELRSSPKRLYGKDAISNYYNCFPYQEQVINNLKA
jgi:hypothetical protein